MGTTSCCGQDDKTAEAKVAEVKATDGEAAVEGATLSIEERIARAREEHPGEQIDCYLLFSSHFDALALHEAARKGGFESRVSTTPRAARATCGVSLLVPCEQAQALNDLAARESIELEGTVALPCQIDPHRDTYC